MKFFNAARQSPLVETLLPLDSSAPPAPTRPAPSAPREGHGPATAKRILEYEFLPGPADILQELLPVSFKVRLFKCFLDAAVSEQIARRVTMKQATENADEMIKNLSRLYNRARQAQITKEIAEVIGGVEALK
jgi:F-type H+-transporting ATPase subunit gamma